MKTVLSMVVFCFFLPPSNTVKVCDENRGVEKSFLQSGFSLTRFSGTWNVRNYNHLVKVNGLNPNTMNPKNLAIKFDSVKKRIVSGGTFTIPFLKIPFCQIAKGIINYPTKYPASISISYETPVKHIFPYYVALTDYSSFALILTCVGNCTRITDKHHSVLTRPGKDISDINKKKIEDKLQKYYCKKVNVVLKGSKNMVSCISINQQ